MPASKRYMDVDEGDLRQLRKRLKELGARDALKDVGVEAAQPALEQAQAWAPRRTGRLQGNLRVGRTVSGPTIAVGNRSSVPYAGVVHFGWPARGIEPQPFLYDAADARAAQVAEKYAEGLEALIREKGLD
jgi:hypothetical protein